MLEVVKVINRKTVLATTKQVKSTVLKYTSQALSFQRKKKVCINCQLNNYSICHQSQA